MDSSSSNELIFNPIYDLLAVDLQMPSYSKNKGILHVGNFLSGKGLTRQFIEELADRLELSGWFVYRTSDAVSRPLRLINMALACWRQRFSYELAHIAVFSGPSFIWAEITALVVVAVGKPFVLSLHGGNLPAFSRRWPKRVKRLLSAASVVVVPSGYLFAHMRDYRRDLLLLPNPLDVSNYPFRQRNKVQPKLVWLRSFHRIYNPLLAPRVLALLAPEFPDIHLTMVGPDKDGSLKKTQELAAELNVSQHITFVGGVPKDDVPTWLEQADIFLNTTNIDNTPISILEAMGCGLPVVSTDVGGIRYLLNDQHNAMLVSPNEPEAMAAAVRRLLTNPSLAGKLSRNGRETVQQFDWSIILPQWESLMTAAAEGGAA